EYIKTAAITLKLLLITIWMISGTSLPGIRLFSLRLSKKMAKEIQENSLPVAFTLLVNGSPVPDTVEVASISLNKEVNRIATAEIRIIEGGAFGLENNTFENIESSVFIPGNELEVKLGYGDEKNLV